MKSKQFFQFFTVKLSSKRRNTTEKIKKKTAANVFLMNNKMFKRTLSTDNCNMLIPLVIKNQY